MKEIGGDIELDTYTGAMLHEKAIALNCGRGALEYLCEAKMIRKLYTYFSFMANMISEEHLTVTASFLSVLTRLKLLLS